MSREGLALPPPTMFGTKTYQPRSLSLQVHIQIPCQIAKYVRNQWDTLAGNALVQLVSQEILTDPITSIECLRVLDIQNQSILNERLTDLKWGELAPLTYELDTLQDGKLKDVYAVTFSSDVYAAQFNDVFNASMSRNPLTDKVLPFLKPLTDAIEAGNVEEAVRRFNFLCQFPAEQRRFKIVAETPLTPEQVKQQNTLNINITVENYEGVELEILLRVPNTTTIGDLKEIMYMTYEIPPEVQKWLGEQCIYKNSEPVLDPTGEPKKIYLYILNAAKVGLNRADFLAKLESKRNKPVSVPEQPQLPMPIDEEEVLPGGQEAEYMYQPQIPTESYVYPSPPGPHQIQSPDEQQIQTIPGVVWACPQCNHMNAWECMRCERCRDPRDKD